MFAFSTDEDHAMNYVKNTRAVSVERIQELSSRQEPRQLTTHREIKAARFGVRFCTRVAFKLEDTIIDMGDYYMLTNTYFVDFIDDISLAATKITVDSGLCIELNKPTPIPTNNNFTGYRFYKGDVDTSKIITGVIFGNSLRKLMNTEQKFLYSNVFLTTYIPTFPYIITPYVGNVLFNLYITDCNTTGSAMEKRLLHERWSHLIPN